MDTFWFVAVIVISYFLGNISPSTLLGRARGVDIKKEGSGNAGTTNALRVLGEKAALITLVIDIGKRLSRCGIGICAVDAFSGNVLRPVGSSWTHLAGAFSFQRRKRRSGGLWRNSRSQLADGADHAGHSGPDRIDFADGFRGIYSRGSQFPVYLLRYGQDFFLVWSDHGDIASVRA